MPATAFASTNSNNCLLHCFTHVLFSLKPEQAVKIMQTKGFDQLCKHLQSYYDLPDIPSKEMLQFVAKTFQHPLERELILGPVFRQFLIGILEAENPKNAAEIANLKKGNALRDADFFKVVEMFNIDMVVESDVEGQQPIHMAVQNPIASFTVQHLQGAGGHYNFEFPGDHTGSVATKHNKAMQVDKQTRLSDFSNTQFSDYNDIDYLAQRKEYVKNIVKAALIQQAEPDKQKVKSAVGAKLDKMLSQKASNDAAPADSSAKLKVKKSGQAKPDKANTGAQPEPAPVDTPFGAELKKVLSKKKVKVTPLPPEKDKKPKMEQGAAAADAAVKLKVKAKTKTHPKAKPKAQSQDQSKAKPPVPLDPHSGFPIAFVASLSKLFTKADNWNIDVKDALITLDNGSHQVTIARDQEGVNFSGAKQSFGDIIKSAKAYSDALGPDSGLEFELEAPDQAHAIEFLRQMQGKGIDYKAITDITIGGKSLDKKDIPAFIAKAQATQKAAPPAPQAPKSPPKKSRAKK